MYSKAAEVQLFNLNKKRYVTNITKKQLSASLWRYDTHKHNWASWKQFKKRIISNYNNLIKKHYLSLCIAAPPVLDWGDVGLTWGWGSSTDSRTMRVGAYSYCDLEKCRPGDRSLPGAWNPSLVGCNFTFFGLLYLHSASHLHWTLSFFSSKLSHAKLGLNLFMFTFDICGSHHSSS